MAGPARTVAMAVCAAVLVVAAPAGAASAPRLSLTAFTPATTPVHSRGALTVGALACNTAHGPCTGRLVLRLVHGGRTAGALASQALQLPASHPTVITVKLTTAAQKALAREHRLRTVLTIRVHDASRRLASLSADRTLVPGAALGCWPQPSGAISWPGASMFVATPPGGDPQTYGCLDRDDNAFALDDPGDAATGSLMVQIPPVDPAPQPIFADRYVAAVLEGNTGPAGTLGTPFWDVAAWDLADGDRVHLDRLGTGADQPTSFVLTPSGAIAWIYGAEGDPSDPVIVGADGTDGYRQLDSGPAIDVSSLRLIGNVVSWTDGVQTRTATLS